MRRGVFCVFCSLELISTASRERNSLILRLTNRSSGQGRDHRRNLGWNMHCIDNHCLHASASALLLAETGWKLAASPRRWPNHAPRGDARLQGGCNWDLTAGEKLGQDCQCVCRSNGERGQDEKEKESHIFSGSGPFHDMGELLRHLNRRAWKWKRSAVSGSVDGEMTLVLNLGGLKLGVDLQVF